MHKQEEQTKRPAGTHTCTYDKSIGCRSRNVVYGVFCEACDYVVYLRKTGCVLYQTAKSFLDYQMPKERDGCSSPLQRGRTLLGTHKRAQGGRIEHTQKIDNYSLITVSQT